MRILTRQIHRAFPELDRYSDEQCDRFVRAARRAFWPRVGRVAVRVTAVLIWLALLIGVAWAAGDRFIEDHFLTPGGVRLVAGIGLGIVAFMVIPLIGWLTWRDVQLRRRIKRILRARATCPGCGYHLIGLFVNAEHKVICTECAMETEVDPSLSELTTDAAGRARFNPAPAPPTWWQRKISAKHKKWFKRSAIGAAVLMLLAIPVGWVSYEFFLRSQAAVAKLERPGMAGLAALIEKRQPPGTSPDSPNAMATLEKAIVLQSQVQIGLWKNGYPKTASGRDAVPDVSYIYGSYEAKSDPDREEMDRLVRAGGLKSLEAWRTAGVFDELKKMAAEPRAARPLDMTSAEPMVSLAFWGSLGQVRNLARGCAAEMHVARLAGDRVKYAESLEQLMALSRVTSQQPFLIDQLVAVAIEALGYGRIQDLLVTHPDEEWLRGIEEALARQTPTGAKSMFEGERMGMLDTAAWLFSDPDNVRWGKYSRKSRAAMMWGGGGIAEGRLGTYAENRDEINEMFDAFDAGAAKDRFERPTASYEESRLTLLLMLTPAIGKALQSQDQVELDRRGVRMQIALERYWLEHKVYPATLAELVPKYIVQLPIDPWSGKPFGYKRIDAAADELGRGYLLYCLGADGKDDGGSPSQSRFDALRLSNATPAIKGATGTDFIINMPSKSPSLQNLPEISDKPAPSEVSPGEPTAPTVE